MSKPTAKTESMSSQQLMELRLSMAEAAEKESDVFTSMIAGFAAAAPKPAVKMVQVVKIDMEEFCNERMAAAKAGYENDDKTEADADGKAARADGKQTIAKPQRSCDHCGGVAQK
jgi:hypothetical protein